MGCDGDELLVLTKNFFNMEVNLFIEEHPVSENYGL
jgi:hypothetical protein